MRIRYKGRYLRLHVDSAGNAVKNGHLWEFLRVVNNEGAGKARTLQDLGFFFDPVSESLLSQSDFVIPGETHYACVRCGSCCRNAKGGCPAGKFLEPNVCLDYGNRPLGCRRFPFRLFDIRPFRSILMVATCCGGYGKGGLVTKERYRKMVEELPPSGQKEAGGGPSLILMTHYDQHQRRWVFDR